MSTGALGMLETYGLITAIEGLDAAVIMKRLNSKNGFSDIIMTTNK